MTPKQISINFLIAAPSACMLNFPDFNNRRFCAFISGLYVLAQTAAIYNLARIRTLPTLLNIVLPLNLPDSLSLGIKPR